MDRLKLSHIDEELDSSEVAALCFLCLDVINKKRLEGIKDARALFLRLEEKGLLENSSFLSQLLQTIRRSDLLSYLETDGRQQEETDASPILSPYRVMLYKIYDNMTRENLDKVKFLLSSKLNRRHMETSDTALDLFIHMENTGLLSKTHLEELHEALQEFDQQLALTVQHYIEQNAGQDQMGALPHVSMDYQTINNSSPSVEAHLSISETLTINEQDRIPSDAEPLEEPSSPSDESDYYPLKHNPRGLCVVINNENFQTGLRKRAGTQEDAKALNSVFTRLGFKVVVLDDMTADGMRQELKKLGKMNFIHHDALVVCVLSHGELGCVFGSDEKEVWLRELTEPFTSKRASTLAGKPKLFFIQACQGKDYQKGSLPCPSSPIEDVEEVQHSHMEEDAGRIQGETVPWDADFLLGMATVSECKSFRHPTKGSIYIQELCSQLERSANSAVDEDILSVLTRVNRNVSRKDMNVNHKQMPEPKYTLTRKLVLKFV